MDATSKYLARWAAPEHRLAGALPGRYPAAVVVPACDESPVFVDLLAPALRGGGLIICVVNATERASERVHAANAALIAALARGGVRLAHGDGPPAHLVARGRLDLLVVDRASPGVRLPDKQGVGLARKIGCDIALAARARGALGSRWIHTTDADAALPPGYFAAATAAPADAVALTYPFAHALDESRGPDGERDREPNRDDDQPDREADATWREALAIYELSLRYYVAGLAHAGSPWAFHTVGSTLAVDAGGYAAVRGVPRREAGEDFYLLDKLAKLGPVVTPACAPIRLAARRSERVPFGTGPATRRIAAELSDGRTPRFYHPKTFALLAVWLDLLARAPHLDAVRAGIAGSLVPLREGFTEGDIAPLREFAARADVIDALTGAFSDRPGRRARRVREWFGAFRTRVFVHAIRDAGLAPWPWREALARAPFTAALAQMAADGASAIALCEAARSAL